MGNIPDPDKVMRSAAFHHGSSLFVKGNCIVILYAKGYGLHVTIFTLLFLFKWNDTFWARNENISSFSQTSQ